MFASLRSNATIRRLRVELLKKKNKRDETHEYKNLEDCLRENTTLQRLEFINCKNIGESVARGLASNKGLTRLEINQCGVDFGILAEGIATSHGLLKHLTINETASAGGTWKGLVKLLKANTARQSLEQLYYSCFTGSFGNEALPQDAQEELLLALQGNISLEVLDLQMNLSKDEGSIIDALPPGVKQFNSQTSFPNGYTLSVMDICTAIPKHPSLQHTEFWLEGDRALLTLLDNFPANLTTIALTITEISNSGLLQLSNFLNAHPALLVVKLQLGTLKLRPRAVSFDEVAIATFIESLPEKSVESLEAFVKQPSRWEEDIDDECGARVRQSLAENYFIKTCSIVYSGSQNPVFDSLDASETLRNRFFAKQQRFKTVKPATSN